MKNSLAGKIKSGLIAISFMGIGIFFTYLALSSFTYGEINEIKNSNEVAIANSVIFLKDTPKYFYVNKDLSGEPKVGALAYLVGDLNTGEVILAKNQEEKLPIASVSKLMTALVAKEIGSVDETAQVSKQALATEGVNGGFRAGEKIKIPDLIYPLLLESSNDAAEVIAEHFGREIFIKKMNQRAENLKMSQTSYEDPSGLSP